MLDTVKTLCYLSGVSGAETEVRDYILERALPYADEMETDSMGNLLIFKKGRVTPARSLMLCAHMDEVGLIVTGITDEGNLRFDCVGGIDRRVLIGKHIFVGHERVHGVIGIKACHLVSKEEEKNVPKVSDMYIDIGAKDKAEAEAQIALGDRGVFEDSILEFGEGYLKAKALDDRLGCAVMLKLLEEDLPRDTWFVFTVQEEVGTRGAFAATFRLKPDIALVLEGTTAADLPGVENGKHICRLGEGVVLPFMDGGAIYDAELRGLLIKLAEENGIKWQTKELIAGGTDASAIQRSGAGARTALIAAGIRNIHTPVSVANIRDLQNVLNLARLFLGAVSEDA